MASCVAFLTDIIDPGLRFLATLGGPVPNDSARRFLLAIAQQESGSRLEARYQGYPAVSPGPARSFWQFEQGGGVRGVLNHSATRVLAGNVCSACIVNRQDQAVWRAMEGHDLLAVSFARLLILTYPGALPKTHQEGWSQYMNLWRPGKPHPDPWPGYWANADKAVQEAGSPIGIGV